MSNSNRFLTGTRKPVRLAVDATIVVEVGDMCFLNTDDVRPASSEPTAATTSTLRQNFANHFIGIAMDPHPSGVADFLFVDISGSSVYQMTCAAATFEVGDKVTPAVASGSNSTAVLDDQTVAKTSTASEAIGHVTKREPANVTVVQCSFASCYADASSNVNAQIG